MLKVVGVQLTHHTAPALRGIGQRTVSVQVSGQVIGSALRRIVRQVQDGQRRGGTVIGALVAVGIKLRDIDLAHVVVGKLFKVALDVGRCQRRGAIGEQRVDVVPRQKRTVVAAGHRQLVAALREEGGHTRDNPRLRFADVNAVLGVLEVVQIRGVVLCAAGSACNELGKLTREGNLRRLCAVQAGQCVQQVREPLALCLPVHVDAPQCILQRLSTHANLRRQRLLTKV